MYVVFLGAPGAGKGTQATAVAERYGLVHISTGDLLREAVRKGTDLGVQAKGFMDRGELVPDALVVGMVIERLAQPDAQKGVLLDGFPRTLNQGKALDEALAARGLGVDSVLYLEVAEPTLVARLAGRWSCPSCGTPYHEVSAPPRVAGKCDQCGTALTQRPDDRAETVMNRLRVYFEQTAPLLDYYGEKGLLTRIDGEQPIAMVGGEITGALDAVGTGRS